MRTRVLAAAVLLSVWAALAADDGGSLRPEATGRRPPRAATASAPVATPPAVLRVGQKAADAKALLEQAGAKDVSATVSVKPEHPEGKVVGFLWYELPNRTCLCVTTERAHASPTDSATVTRLTLGERGKGYGDQAAWASQIQFHPQELQLPPPGAAWNNWNPMAGEVPADAAAIFFGVGPAKGGAAHVVYVIDRSGSMLHALDAVKQELLTSIGRLDANHRQDFHVIFFAAGLPLEMAGKDLVPASSGSREAVAGFLKGVNPRGTTDPIPAIERAFDVLEKAGPGGKTMYLLTDSLFPDNQQVLELFRKRNVAKDVRVFTFLYGDRPKEAEETMKRLAADHGGKYRFVSGED